MTTQAHTGNTQIITMDLMDHTLNVELLHEPMNDVLNNEADIYHVDMVKIPITFIKPETKSVLYEQLITNDLKHVGYDYQACTEALTTQPHTMYHTQVKGTLSIILKELGENV